MNDEAKDPRSADIDRPPSRLGRLLLALRETVGRRGMAPGADPEFRKLCAETKPERLSRSMAAEWALKIAGIQVSEKQIQRVETGERRTHEIAQLRGLLRSYGLGVDEIEAVVGDPELNRTGGNPHLIADWRLRGLAVYEFGPLINEALKIGDRCSTWLEVEKAGSGGYGLVDAGSPRRRARREPEPRICRRRHRDHGPRHRGQRRHLQRRARRASPAVALR